MISFGFDDGKSEKSGFKDGKGKVCLGMTTLSWVCVSIYDSRENALTHGSFAVWCY